jgi:medium-chain acyl-[acyl-carrier-protein] hydrolase
MEQPSVWTEGFRVRAYEVDARGRASVPAIANWMQEAAGNHATALGWAVDELHRKGLTWVLSRLHLRLHHQPAWREEVQVSTWPTGAQRLFALRDFRLTGAQARELGIATTGWLLLDLAGRRPTRPPEAVAELGRTSPARAITDPFEKLPELSGADVEEALVVRFADLDMNRHANNVSVIGWALEAVPGEVLWGSSLAELEIEFRAEALYGDRITSQVQEAPGEPLAFLHRLVREADGREIARARTVWRSG